MKSHSVEFARRASEAVLALSLSLSCFLFVLGMPWHNLGLWVEQELPAAGLHLLTSIVVVAVGFLLLLRDERALGALTSWTTIALGAFSVLGLALAPMTDDPWRSVYGTLQHHVGALWHLELTVLVIGSMVVMASRYKGLFIGALLLSSAIVAFLYAFRDSGFGTPIRFHEWAGMMAGSAALVVALKSQRFLSLANAAAAAVFVAGMYVSGNRAVLLAALAIAALFALSRLASTKQLLAKPSVRVVLAVAVVMFGMAATHLAAPLIEGHRLRSLPPAVPGVLSEKAIDHVSMMDGSLGTVWSRSYMVRMVVDQLKDNPSGLLFGNGWGAFPSLVQTYGREVPGRLFPAKLESASRTYWDAHGKATFHSHNVAAETLLSTGVVGFLAWIAFIGALAAVSRRGLYVSVAIGTVSTFWFPVTHLVAPLAAMIAAGSVMGRPSEGTRTFISAVSSLPVALTAFATAMAGILVYGLAVVETEEKSRTGVVFDRNPETCQSVRLNFLPQEEAQRFLYRALVERIMASEDRYEAAFERTTNVILHSCTLRSHSLEAPSLLSLTESLSGRERLAKIKPPVYGMIAEDLAAWGSDLDALLTLAPDRTDYIPPYVIHLRSRNPNLAVEEAGRLLLATKGEDPVHWFLKSIIADGSRDLEASKEHMRKAFSLGYANIFPTSSELVRSVMN